ncbi:magnesium transporter [Palleronia sp. KMU-117]|uniref:magnesium transporter n=1 Tax=Palleronia sp. KMU-117 TaxID=3434108 RepID=UPI003D746F68
MADDATTVEDRDDEGFGLDDRLVPDVRLALAAGDRPRLASLLDPLHPADIADLLEQIGTGERREVLLLAPQIITGEVLSEIDEGLREEVIAFLPRDQLAEAVRELDSDDVVDLLEDLDLPQQEAVLDALEDADRLAAERALSYPEYSAGRLMQREVVTAPEHWNVGQTIDHLRASAHLPDQFYHVVLVDPRHRPTGYVTLGRLMSAPRATRLVDITDDSFRTVPVLQDEGDVAYLFNQYHLISAPVVDQSDRLVGVITIDDAMIVLDEEHEEDVLRLAGVSESSMSDSVLATVKSRIPWLVVNLGTAGIAATVIAQFEGSIAQIVALAVLMPIVASMGGNAGTQSLAVAVRALATRDLTSSNAWRVIRREALVGLANGLSLAIPLGIATALLFGSAGLGAVIACALVINLFVAALAGILVPFLLEKLGLDPAIASGTFVTTVTDVVGFLSFLGLATIVLL